jgi:streptogramin lyase
MTAEGKVLRLDPRTNQIVAQVPGAFRPADLAVGPEGVWVWVVDKSNNAVVRVDPYR